MICYLEGCLQEKELSRIVINVNGIGYELLIPMSTYDHLPQIGQDMSIHTYLHVREDALVLFGFASVKEKMLFNMVCSVSGIGPKIGLNVLSCMSVESFCANIVNQDAKALGKISGVGKRTAERMVVDLKGKIKDIEPAIAITGKDNTKGSVSATTQLSMNRAAEDAVNGLIALGIKADAAREAIHEIYGASEDKEITADRLIRQALTKINS